MKVSRDFAERRQHERSSVPNILIGILNSDEPVMIGLINDISLGGIKYTHKLKMVPNDNPIHSIDLIADNNCLMIDIPCKYAWNDGLQGESDSESGELMQCGIQFGKMTPNQIFLLKGLINHYKSLGTKGVVPNVHIIHS